jgi:DNA-directed RNA polymerase specialized sigma24 family protein
MKSWEDRVAAFEAETREELRRAIAQLSSSQRANFERTYGRSLPREHLATAWKLVYATLAKHGRLD